MTQSAYVCHLGQIPCIPWTSRFPYKQLRNNRPQKNKEPRRNIHQSIGAHAIPHPRSSLRRRQSFNRAAGRVRHQTHPGRSFNVCRRASLLFSSPHPPSSRARNERARAAGVNKLQAWPPAKLVPRARAAARRATSEHRY